MRIKIAPVAALTKLKTIPLAYRIRLARSLFEKEEQMLPEGETWDGLVDGDHRH